MADTSTSPNAAGAPTSATSPSAAGASTSPNAAGASTSATSELECDWVDDLLADEDSAVEESEDEALNSKLCTFTVTQKEFMNQHW